MPEIIETKEKSFHLQQQLAHKAVEYTTTTGSYVSWKIDVDLGSPNPSVPMTPEDTHIYDYYNALQYSLYENNLPETVDRTKDPRTKKSHSGVCIVLLASPVECLAILAEGGRQCPGDMLLVSSPSWLIKEKSETCEGLHSLYVKKAITFERGGCTYIDVFEHPRKCTYFVNFFTRSATDGQRNDGEAVELDLDCPMSSSIELCKRVDDKLLTRIWMAEAEVFYPETLAIVYRPAYEYDVPNHANITVLVLEDKDGMHDRVRDEVKNFLKSETLQQKGRVVVKPSGISWHGSRGVSFHDTSDFEGIYRAVNTLLDILEVENTVLVEAFHAPPTIQNGEIDDYSYRLRVNVCRGPDNTAVTTQMVCGIGKKNQPINGDNTIPLTFETTMETWEIEPSERLRLLESVKYGSERVLESIIRYEDELSADYKGGIGAQTDLVGIDYVLSEVNDKLEAVGIEVNSHDCTINCQLFENLNPHRKGEAVKPLVETMIKRSELYSMKDKRVLVIGAGGFSKRFIWDEYDQFGIKVCLVDPEADTYGASKVERFIQYDFLDHVHDDQHAENIMEIIRDMEIKIHGCVTFWEDCGPLAAIIGERMGFRGPGEKGAKIAKMKSLTQTTLRARTGDIPHFPRTYLYTAKVMHVANEADIDLAVEYVGLPAVLKLEFGSSGVGVKPVDDWMQCRNVFYQIKDSLHEEEDHPGIGLGHGNDLLLMEKLTGTEHDVDLIIFDRQLIAAFISDNGPTKPGSYTETTATMPTCLRPDRQGQLITAAYQCCTEIGLVDGVFNVEMKMSTSGPRLIEINARMAGFYLRDWIKACYGVDILKNSFMCCLGIRPIIPKPVPKCQIMGTICVPSLHREQLSDINRLAILENFIQQGDVRYNQIEETLESCGKEGLEEPFCSIAVCAEDVHTAKYKLMDVCTALDISSLEYDLNYYLKDFK